MSSESFALVRTRVEGYVIVLTRLNGQEFVANAELVELVESTPDTIVSLTTGKKYMVKETVDDVVERIIQYRRQISPFFDPGVVKKPEEIS